MNRKILFGMTLPLAIMGAVLIILGAVLTITWCNTTNVLYGYPYLIPPLSPYMVECGPFPPPSSTSVNYTLNFVGIAILLTAIALPLEPLKSEPQVRTVPEVGS